MGKEKPPTAGYSKRPLVEKLGIKAGAKIAILGAPPNYAATLGELPASTTVHKKLHGPLDFIHFLCKERRALESEFPKLKRALQQSGMLWLSLPKGSSNAETDLSDNAVREVGLKNGLVDVKVCAVDEIWSGLKFVYRLRDRQRHR
jgi:hypothetical protein